MRLNFIFFFLFLLFSGSIINAQDKKDSIYYKIERFSDKTKTTKFIHRFIFRREADSVSVKSKTVKPVQISHDGKIIRNITIETTDPFGYKISDKTQNAKWYDRLANHIHVDSKKSTIENYLLFKKGEEYNAQKLYESERVLRDMNFVNRVNISIIDSTLSRDSIDVSVKILDSWSLKPRLRYSGKKFGIGLTEENLLGLGHEVDFLYTNNSSEKQNNIFASYTANNIYGTFINAQISGEKDFFSNERLTFAATRDFFSPLTKWAGGFSFEFFKRNVLLPEASQSIFPEVQIKVYNQDLWYGYQVPVFRNNKDEISRNIAFLGRLQNYQYKDRPEIDEKGFFTSNTSFLASVKFIERKFAVKQNIFQYQLPEDIPYGKSIGVTGGFINRGTRAVPYGGLSAAYGSFMNWGYLTATAQYGRFFNEDRENSDSFRFDATYFTNLMDLKFAKVRHFFSPTFVWGSDLYNTSYRDRINFSSRNEFPVYSEDFIGTKKLVLRYQIQLFIDKTWKNFHFSPYGIATVGWLSRNDQDLLKAKANAKFGVGLLINNPYLVFNRIQLSFVFYPKIPLDNKAFYEFNGYRTDLFPLNDFATDKPHFVNFNN